jgi:5'-phosphate synthase pdxT subunit
MPVAHSDERLQQRSSLVGVLALQGDFREHRLMLESLGAQVLEVRQPAQLAGLEGLVIPGGESTTMAKLMAACDLADAIRSFACAGHPLYGSCAGLIMLARDTVEGSPKTLGLMDIVARRNAFGRQLQSFEADLEISGLDGGPLRGVFIRAPWIEQAGPGVRVLASYGGHIVAAEEGGLSVTAFHPELTGDTRFHAYFLEMARASRRPPTAPRDAEVASATTR